MSLFLTSCFETLVSSTLRLFNSMIANNNLPVNNAPELVACAKENTGKLAFGK